MMKTLAALLTVGVAAAGSAPVPPSLKQKVNKGVGLAAPAPAPVLHAAALLKAPIPYPTTKSTFKMPPKASKKVRPGGDFISCGAAKPAARPFAEEPS